MHGTRFTASLSLAILASLAMADRASASFDYATVLTSGSSSAGSVVISGGNLTLTDGGTTVTLVGISATDFTVPTPVPDTVKFVNVIVSSTDTTPLSLTLNYAAQISLSNVSPPGTNMTQLLPFSGTLTLTDVSSTTGSVTNTFNAPNSGSVIVGGVLYSGGVHQSCRPDHRRRQRRDQRRSLGRGRARAGLDRDAGPGPGGGGGLWPPPSPRRQVILDPPHVGIVGPGLASREPGAWTFLFPTG